MPFPLAKLISLGLKQMSRHVATFVKDKAQNNQKFRATLIKGAGWYHSLKTNTQLSILGLGKAKDIKPLTEQAAIELGCEIINDLVVITSALTIFIAFESWPSKGKDMVESGVKQEELLKLNQQLEVQNIQLEKQAAKIHRLESIIVRKMGTENMAEKFKLGLGKEHTVFDRSFKIRSDQIVIEDLVKPPER